MTNSKRLGTDRRFFFFGLHFIFGHIGAWPFPPACHVALLVSVWGEMTTHPLFQGHDLFISLGGGGLHVLLFLVSR